VEALYNPTVGDNIVSSEYAYKFLIDMPLAPTHKTLRTSDGELLKGCGILQNVSVKHENVDIMLLMFSTFEISIS
jgi:hypothetical protein